MHTFGRGPRAAAWVSAAALVVACSSDRDPSEIVDRDPPPSEAPAPSPDAGTSPEAAPAVEVDDAGRGCAPDELLCASIGACVPGCAHACAGAPAECVLCPSSGGPASRRCQPSTLTASGLLDGCPLERRCPCTGPGDCAGVSQTCVQGRCRACGEAETDGKECPDGRMCTAGSCGR